MLQNSYGEVISIAMFAVALAAAEIGLLAAKRQRNRAVNTEAFAAAQTAMFSILGLLFAFTFSLALSRFDARKDAVVREASAISTAIARADVLDAGDRATLLADLTQYVQTRIGFVEAASDQAAQDAATAQSVRLQRGMWDVAMRSARSSDRPQMISLVIQSLNDVADASALEAAVADAHIPDGVLAILFAIAALAVGVAGFNTGLRGGRSIAFVLLALVLALVTTAIVDMDRPQTGFIRVDLTPLQNVQRAQDPGR